jgi:hypothetical protein
MAVACDPQSLLQAAKCFENCTLAGQRDAIKIYLLALIAGVNPDPVALMEAARCLTCLQPGQAQAVQTYLLCTIANK